MRRPPLIVAATGVALAAIGLPLARGPEAATTLPFRAPSWSADGRHVAFVRNRTLLVANLRGSVKRIGTVLDVGQPYRWLPRRNELVYATRRALVRSSSDGARRNVLASGNFAFSEPCCFVATGGLSVFDVRADGAFVVAKRTRTRCTEFFTVDTRTRRARRLLCDAAACPRCNPAQPRWVGERFVSVLEVRGARGHFSSVVDARTRRIVRRLVTTPVLEAAWSRDRTRVAYVTRPPVAIPESPVEVRLRVLPDRSDVAVGAGANLRWSPDSSRLAFEREHGVVTTIVSSDGRTKRELTKTAGLTWSPDARKTAFIVEGSLAVGDADGGGARRLAPAGHAFGAATAWSPDGTWIAFARSDEPGIWIVRPDGTGLRRLAPP